MVVVVVVVVVGGGVVVVVVVVVAMQERKEIRIAIAYVNILQQASMGTEDCYMAT